MEKTILFSGVSKPQIPNIPVDWQLLPVQINNRIRTTLMKSKAVFPADKVIIDISFIGPDSHSRTAAGKLVSS